MPEDNDLQKGGETIEKWGKTNPDDETNPDYQAGYELGKKLRDPKNKMGAKEVKDATREAYEASKTEEEKEAFKRGFRTGSEE